MSIVTFITSIRCLSPFTILADRSSLIFFSTTVNTNANLFSQTSRYIYKQLSISEMIQSQYGATRSITTWRQDFKFCFVFAPTSSVLYETLPATMPCLYPAACVTRYCCTFPHAASILSNDEAYRCFLFLFLFYRGLERVAYVHAR